MTVAAVVSRRAGAVHERLPAVRVVPDVAALLAIPEIPLVVIATPNDVHEAQATATLAAGRHTVVDKPLVTTVAAADRLLRAASDSGALLVPFHNRRWDGDFLTVRRLLDSGTLGELHTFEARWNRYRPDIPDRWRERVEQGGGLLLDLGPHLIDQALQLFGKPEWLQADLMQRRPGSTVEDAFEIRMGRGPLRIVLGADSLTADPGPRFRLHGSLGSYSKWGLDVQEEQLRAGREPGDAEFGVEPAAQWGELHSGAAAPRRLPSERGRWLSFYESLRTAIESGTAAAPVAMTDAREGLRLIEAARRSSEQGVRIIGGAPMA
jgi:scyllo-inositol 2-dehydrogenase (NADP+)